MWGLPQNATHIKPQRFRTEDILNSSIVPKSSNQKIQQSKNLFNAVSLSYTAPAIPHLHPIPAQRARENKDHAMTPVR